jgi:hypothetical protein
MEHVRIVGEEAVETPEKVRLRRIKEARDALAKRHAEDPAGVARYQARQAHLAAAKKRERERFETRCLGQAPEPEPMPKNPTGVSKSEWRIEKARILRERRKALAEARRYLGRAGTADTNGLKH